MSPTSVGQLRTILVATDFSFTSERAYKHARSMASSTGADLRLVHVVVPREVHGNGEGSVEGDIGTERLELEGRMRDLLGDVPRARYSVRKGRAAEVIVAEAAATGADLIVIGADGLTHWRRPRLGSTVRRVIEHAPCPVLIVHAADRVRGERPRRILVATDFSEGARAAARRAADLLGISGADTLVLAHAHHLSPTFSLTVGPFSRPEIDGLVRQGAVEQLELEAAELRVAGLAPRPELLDGLVVVDALVAKARNLDADLIVTGTVGRTGLAHLLLGSTAERVAERARCPVLVVPAAVAAPVLMDVDAGAVTASAGATAIDEQC